MGCVHIYCGDGKGKTTAAVGLAVRMAGNGGRVVMARFLKNDSSGEVAALSALPGIDVLPCEKSFGFTWQMTEDQKVKAAEYYGGLLEKAFSAAGEACEAEPGRDLPVLLVLDEVCAALNAGLLKERQVLSFLNGRPERLEVVLTGREPSEALKERADYISRIEKIKHPFDAGLPARRGIEF